MNTYRIDQQWIYAAFKGYAGAQTWAPIALIDRISGKVYSLNLHILSNDEAARLVWGKR